MKRNGNERELDKWNGWEEVVKKRDEKMGRMRKAGMESKLDTPLVKFSEK